MKLKNIFKMGFSVVALVGIFASQTVLADETAEGLELMKKTDCFTCHRPNQKLIGPAYKDVANKYKGADDAKITELAQKVIKGGSGNWGAVPMSAHPALVEADVKKMVKWVLSLADGAAPASAPAATAPAVPAATTN